MRRNSIDIAPLVSFRILYGLLAALGLLWSIGKGDITERFHKPVFFFSYEGWEWVSYAGDQWILPIYIVGITAAIGVSLGVFYRFSVLLFGLCFSYLHTIDATNYINHYYLIWLLSVLLILVPANAAFSLDRHWGWVKPHGTIPKWMLDIFKLQVAIVYIFAGIAKLNPDWLFQAMPLKIWCLQHQDFPILGTAFGWSETHYAMSWMGAFYDLTIVGWLLWKRTRVLAYIAVLLFHILTAFMFDIGLFPPLMIIVTLVFFPPAWHRWILDKWPLKNSRQNLANGSIQFPLGKYFTLLFLILFFLSQFFLPIRHLFFTNENIRFTQDYYRYGWRVMLVENDGLLRFNIIDSTENRLWVLDAGNIEEEALLTPYQIKRMSVQPEHIRQFAHYLADLYAKRFNINRPMVKVDAFVAINGRLSKPLINPDIDLAKVEWSWSKKYWLLE